MKIEYAEDQETLKPLTITLDPQEVKFLKVILGSIGGGYNPDGSHGFYPFRGFVDDLYKKIENMGYDFDCCDNERGKISQIMKLKNEA